MATKQAAKTTEPTTVSEESPIIQINKVARETIFIPIIGTAPLIVSRFSEKAKRAMLDKQQGRRTLKEKRDPQTEYEASLYRLGEGYGFPAVGFKKATIGGARYYGKSVTMTELRQYLFFSGETSPTEAQMLVRINGEPKLREDYVRLAGAGRSADLRYRGEFVDWTAVLEIVYVKTCISRESVLSLVEAGGMGVGVGEWRPEHNGEFGTYQIDQSRSINAIDKDRLVTVIDAVKAAES